MTVQSRASCGLSGARIFRLHVSGARIGGHWSVERQVIPPLLRQLFPPPGDPRFLASLILAVVQHEADVVCGLLREFDSLDSCHSKAEKAITTARAVADTLRSDIAAALRRLDSVLQG